MKKASFFIVLGLAVLLLFGCAGGGGPLGGVSKEPEGTWQIALRIDKNNDDEDGCEFQRGSFYVNVRVNDAKDGYDAKVEDKNRNTVPGVDVPTFTYKDRVVKLEIKKGTEGGDEENIYYFKLEGEFYNGTSDQKDVMIGTFNNEWESDDKGIWVGIRKEFLLNAASIDNPEILAERAKEIEELVEKELGYKIKIDLSELMK